MSPLDRELMETLGELVLVKQASDIRPLLAAGAIGAGVGAGGLLASQAFKKKDYTDVPAVVGDAASKGIKRTRDKAREAGRSAVELGKDPLFIGSAAGGAGLGALLIHKLRKRRQAKQQQQELEQLSLDGSKVAVFKWLGGVADDAARAVGRGVRAGAKPVARGAWNYGVKKPYEIALEAGGIAGINKQRALLQTLKADPKASKNYEIIRQLAEAKGMKSPMTALNTFFNPMSSLTGRMTESGHARWLLGELSDPVKAQQFLVNATPAQAAALKKLAPFLDQARKAGHTSLAGQLAPIGIIGAPIAYNLAVGDSEADKRPVVTAPRRGFSPPKEEGEKEPNKVERFWEAAGDKVRGFSPGLGDTLANHPYLSTAGSAALLGGGAAALFGGRGNA